jgi:hypothetical protein
MADFYIRKPGTTETRGPFNEEKLTSLAEAGQVTPETEVTDQSRSSWLPVGEIPGLKAVLFPERKKLGLKKEGAPSNTNIPIINKPDEQGAPPLTVNQMLAAAEGETLETLHMKEGGLRKAKVAGLSLPVLTVMMILSGLTNSLPNYPAFMGLFNDSNWQGLIQKPFALVGLLDFFLALCLFLNVMAILPVVRFRAMIGMGYFCYICWSINDTLGMVASLGAGLGMFVCTITLDMYVMIVFAALGVAGMGYLAWVAWGISAIAL